MNTLILSHIRYMDIEKIESIQNLLESIDTRLKTKRQKPHKLFISNMMINKRKFGFIDLENLMHSATDTLVKSCRTFSFHLGTLEKHEDRIIIPENPIHTNG